MTFTDAVPPSAPVLDVNRTRWQLAGGLAGLGVLAAFVPTPIAVLRTLGGSQAAIGGDPATVAALTVGSLVVWTALGMAAAIGATVLMARLPGSAGAFGRAVLARLLPRRWRPWIGALAGLALLSGVAACGTGVAAAADPGSSAVATAIVSPTPTAAGPLLNINGLDWPTEAASTEFVGSPESPHPSIASTSAGDHTSGESSPSRGSAVSVSKPTSTSSTAPQPATATPGAAPQKPDAAKPVTVGQPPRQTPTAGAAPTPATVLPGPAPTRGPAPGAPTSTSPVSTAPGSTTASASTPGPTSTTSTTAAKPLVVVVEPGDSLWRIAARQLPAGTNGDTIDAAWRLWYAANRSVIGADPNFILPGQRLRAPDSAVTR